MFYFLCTGHEFCIFVSPVQEISGSFLILLGLYYDSYHGYPQEVDELVNQLHEGGVHSTIDSTLLLE